MNDKILIVCACSFVCGCVGTAVRWAENDALQPPVLTGAFVIKSEADSLNKELKRGLEKRIAGQEEEMEQIPVTVACSCIETKDANGGVAAVNNIFSICTLGIWPYVSSESSSYELKIKSPYGYKSERFGVGVRSWKSFLFPFAALPCPGWGDDREFISMGSIYAVGDKNPLSKEFVNKVAANVALQAMDQKFYDKALKKHWYAVSQLRQSVMRIDPAMSVGDHRPIVLIDENDIQARVTPVRNDENFRQTTDGGNLVVEQTAVLVEPDTAKLGAKLEHELSALGFHVVSRASIAKDIKDRELFDVLNGKQRKGCSISIPAFRVSMSVLEHKCYSKKSHSRTVSTRSHHFKPKTVNVCETDTLEKRGVSELLFRVTNLQNGETEITKRYFGEVTDSSSGIAAMHKNHRGPKEYKTVGKMLKSDESFVDAATDKVFTQFFESFVRSFSYRPVACSQHGIVTLEIPQEHVQVGSLLCVLTREGSGRAMSEREVALLRVNSVSRDGCSAEIAEVTDVNAEWNVVIRVK